MPEDGKQHAPRGPASAPRAPKPQTARERLLAAYAPTPAGARMLASDRARRAAALSYSLVSDPPRDAALQTRRAGMLQAGVATPYATAPPARPKPAAAPSASAPAVRAPQPGAPVPVLDAAQDAARVAELHAKFPSTFDPQDPIALRAFSEGPTVAEYGGFPASRADTVRAHRAQLQAEDYDPRTPWAGAFARHGVDVRQPGFDILEGGAPHPGNCHLFSSGMARGVVDPGSQLKAGERVEDAPDVGAAFKTAGPDPEWEALNRRPEGPHVAVYHDEHGQPSHSSFRDGRGNDFHRLQGFPTHVFRDGTYGKTPASYFRRRWAADRKA